MSDTGARERTPISKSIRDAVKQMFSGKCGYCGEHPDKLQIDHKVPVADGGSNELSNLMPACFSCNNYKMSFSIEQLRVEISEQVYRARKYSLNYRLAERFELVVPTGKPVVFYFDRALKEKE